MRIFDSARSIGSIHAVVRTMREDGIIRVTGPFRRRNGTFVYSVEDFVVTERELLDLAEAGKLDPTGVSELTAKIKQGQLLS